MSEENSLLGLMDDNFLPPSQLDPMAVPDFNHSNNSAPLQNQFQLQGDFSQYSQYPMSMNSPFSNNLAANLQFNFSASNFSASNFSGSYFSNTNSSNFNFQPSLSGFQAADSTTKLIDPKDTLYKLGKTYEEGLSVKKDLDIAYNNYQIAATLGHVEATFKVAQRQEDSSQAEELQKALSAYELLMKKNHLQAHLRAASMHAFGKGTPKNIKKAVEILEQAKRLNRGNEILPKEWIDNTFTIVNNTHPNKSFIFKMIRNKELIPVVQSSQKNFRLSEFRDIYKKMFSLQTIRSFDRKVLASDPVRIDSLAGLFRKIQLVKQSHRNKKFVPITIDPMNYFNFFEDRTTHENELRTDQNWKDTVEFCRNAELISSPICISLSETSFMFNNFDFNKIYSQKRPLLPAVKDIEIIIRIIDQNFDSIRAQFEEIAEFLSMQKHLQTVSISIDWNYSEATLRQVKSLHGLKGTTKGVQALAENLLIEHIFGNHLLVNLAIAIQKSSICGVKLLNMRLGRLPQDQFLALIESLGQEMELKKELDNSRMEELDNMQKQNPRKKIIHLDISNNQLELLQEQRKKLDCHKKQAMELDSDTSGSKVKDPEEFWFKLGKALSKFETLNIGNNEFINNSLLTNPLGSETVFQNVSKLFEGFAGGNIERLYMSKIFNLDFMPSSFTISTSEAWKSKIEKVKDSMQSFLFQIMNIIVHRTKIKCIDLHENGLSNFLSKNNLGRENITHPFCLLGKLIRESEIEEMDLRGNLTHVEYFYKKPPKKKKPNKKKSSHRMDDSSGDESPDSMDDGLKGCGIPRKKPKKSKKKPNIIQQQNIVGAEELQKSLQSFGQITDLQLEDKVSGARAMSINNRHPHPVHRGQILDIQKALKCNFESMIQYREQRGKIVAETWEKRGISRPLLKILFEYMGYLPKFTGWTEKTDITKVNYPESVELPLKFFQDPDDISFKQSQASSSQKSNSLSLNMDDNRSLSETFKPLFYCYRVDTVSKNKVVHMDESFNSNSTSSSNSKNLHSKSSNSKSNSNSSSSSNSNFNSHSNSGGKFMNSNNATNNAMSIDASDDLIATDDIVAMDNQNEINQLRESIENKNSAESSASNAFNSSNSSNSVPPLQPLLPSFKLKFNKRNNTVMDPNDEYSKERQQKISKLT